MTTGVIIGSAIATADKRKSTHNPKKVPNFPDIRLTNASSEAGNVKMVLKQSPSSNTDKPSDYISPVGEKSVPLSGLNQPSLTDLSITERIKKAKKEIGEIDQIPAGPYQMEVTFRDKKQVTDLYISENGLPDAETLTITIRHSGEIDICSELYCSS